MISVLEALLCCTEMVAMLVRCEQLNILLMRQYLLRLCMTALLISRASLPHRASTEDPLPTVLGDVSLPCTSGIAKTGWM